MTGVNRFRLAIRRIVFASFFLYFIGVFLLPVIFLNTGGVTSLFFKHMHENLYFYVYGSNFYSIYSKWLCGHSINCVF